MQDINGIIVINKPKEYTSHDVVAKVKKILNIKKVGHTGTLDPNATGVLPLLLNTGTKLSKYLIEHDKEYEVTLELGIKTDTADIEGNEIKKEEINWEKLNDIEETLNTFLGEQTQIPPIYSAIKVNGKKLYEYARSGQNINIEPRNIQIYKIELQKIDKEKNEINFRVHCSKGTYIRSLCEDIAQRLGTIGYMKELTRTKVGNFTISEAVKIEEIENNKEQIIKEKLISIEKFFESKESIKLNKKQLDKFLNGVKIRIDKQENICRIYNENNEFIGIGTIEKNFLKRDIIL